MLLPILLGGGPLGPVLPLVSSVQYPSIRDSYVSGGVTKPGAVGDGVTDDTAAIQHWLNTAKGILRAPGPQPGDAANSYKYRVTSALSYANNGTILVGDGQDVSVIQPDDGFDVFSLHSLRGCGIVGCAINSTSPRTSGYAIRVWGGTADANNQFPNFTSISRGSHLFDVDMFNQFNGIGFEDENNRGDWGTTIGTWRQSTWNKFAAGGTGIFFNTYKGGPQTVNNLAINALDGTGAGPAVKYRGSGLISINGLVTNGMGGGFVCDPSQNPSVAGDGVALLNNCVFDSTDVAGTADNILINPQTGFTGTLFVQMSNCWVSGARHNGLHVTGIASGVSLTWVSGVCFSNQQWGVLVDNGAGNVAIGVSVQGGGTGGVIMSGNVSGNTHYV